MSPKRKALSKRTQFGESYWLCTCSIILNSITNLYREKKQFLSLLSLSTGFQNYQNLKAMPQAFPLLIIIIKLRRALLLLLSHIEFTFISEKRGKRAYEESSFSWLFPLLVMRVLRKIKQLQICIRHKKGIKKDCMYLSICKKETSYYSIIMHLPEAISKRACCQVSWQAFAKFHFLRLLVA